ncbi:MAG: hypothetical protein NC825_02105 [Candidatus Omnitrophica bacterium]|nr:hypothetical protein [Candidatus Omnitrophota bacterium]
MRKICSSVIAFGLVILLAEISSSQEAKISLRDVIGAFGKNEFDRTIELCDKAIKQGATEPEFYYYLGSAYAKIQKNNEAIQSLRTFLSKADYTKNAWLLRSSFQTIISIHRTNNDYPAVIEDGNLFLRNLKEGKDTGQLETFAKNLMFETLRDLGNQKYNEKDYKQASNIYKMAIQFRPDDLVLLEKIAICYKNLNEQETAAEYYLMAAMKWKAWSSKMVSLLSMLELIWEKDKFDEFAKKAEADEISKNVIIAAGMIKKKNYKDAFSILNNIEKNAGSNGSISYRIANALYSKMNSDPYLIYHFMAVFPEYNFSSCIDMLMNSGRMDPEKARIIRDEIFPRLAQLIEEKKDSSSIRNIYIKIVDLKFIGIPENRETAEGKIKMLREFREKYPDDPSVPEIIRKEASLYVDILSDYQKGKELYGILVKKFDKKDAIPQLVKCLINLGEFDDVYGLIKDFLSEKNVSEHSKFQAGQFLVQANFFDEGIKVLKEIDAMTKNKWLKQQIKDILKDFRQYLKDDIPVDTESKFIVLNVKSEKYYFTNFVSITADSPVLFQERERLEIISFSQKRQYIFCNVTGKSSEEISLTEPYTMIFKCPDCYTVSLKSKIPFSPDRWRKSEGISLIYPWKDIRTESIKVIRSYNVEGNYGVSTIDFEKLEPGTKIEVVFSTRAGKFSGATPESSEAGPGGAMVFYPQNDKFQIIIKFEPVPELLAYYPKVRISKEVSSEKILNTTVDEFSLKGINAEFHIDFDSQLKIYSISTRQEILYEIDEKIDI